MMNAAPSAHRDLFGIFELDSAGNVLYNRAASRSEPDRAEINAVGRNFYDVIANFKNVNDLRRRLTAFMRNHNSVESFAFNPEFENCTLRVRVMLVRVSERDANNRTKSMIVDIRENQIF